MGKDSSPASSSSSPPTTTIPLSLDLLLRVFSMLQSPRDICHAAMANAQFRRAAADPGLWKSIAEHRYGRQVLQDTQHLYDNDYRRMVLDDNRQGALPTLWGIWSSPWRRNSHHTFYCCLVTAVKWHRARRQVWIYLDVRGEPDLRRPQSSGLWVRDPKTNKTRMLDTERVLPPRPNPDGSYFLPDVIDPPVRDWNFVSTLSPRAGNGRYQGYLCVDADLLIINGQYEFCYACARPTYSRDYDSCTLFTIRPGQTLHDVFPTFSTEQDDPLRDESPDMRQERWRPYLLLPDAPTANPFGPWPECVGMRGRNAAAYILSQNPDLDVQIIPHGQRVTLDFRGGRVRFWVNAMGIVDSPPDEG